MTTFNHYEMIFENRADMLVAFEVYGMTKTPSACGRRYVGHAFDDNGSKVMVLAERLLGNPLAFRFSDVAPA